MSSQDLRSKHLEEFMQYRFTRIGASCLVALTCGITAAAQTPAPDNILIDSPTYTFIPMEIDVDRAAADVWERIGGYCDIGEWFGMPCTITSGTEDEFGCPRGRDPANAAYRLLGSRIAVRS